MGWLVLVLLGLGVVAIIVNYVGVLPGGSSDWYLMGGLALLLVGLLVATRYR